MKPILFIIRPLYTPLEFFYIFFAIRCVDDSAYLAAGIWLIAGVVGQSVFRVIAKRKGLIE
jgi:hypothetical protein